MTKIQMTRHTLLDIGGFTSLKAKQLAGAHILKKDLKLSSDQLLFLANRFNKTLKTAGSSRTIVATALRDNGFRVADCIVLMLKKGLDIDVKPDNTKDLIAEARKDL